MYYLLCIRIRTDVVQTPHASMCHSSIFKITLIHKRNLFVPTGNSCDMDFGGTVRLCSSLVLVCTSLGEIAALHGSNKPRRIELISADTRKQVAFFRAW